MTRQDIESLNYLDLTIQRLKDELADMEALIGIGSPALDGMPHGSMPGRPTERMAVEIAEQISKIQEAEKQAKEKKLEVMRWYNKLEDELIKSIIYYKFIKHNSWRNTAAKIGCCEASTYFRMYDSFWKRYSEQAN